MNPRHLLLAAALVIVGCPANNTPQPMPPSPPPSGGYEPPDPVDPAGGGDTGGDTGAEPEPGGAEPPAVDAGAGPVVQGPQPDGSPCLAAADCTSGVCEGQGCSSDQPGVCKPKSRRCTRDRRAYCGCDGTTFFGSGTCPGKRYSARDMCPDGQ